MAATRAGGFVDDLLCGAAAAEMRAWIARLFTAPRESAAETWWMSAVASSENRVSVRPARPRWWS